MTHGKDSVITIDCNYLMPRFAASYLVREKEKALFVDNNTAHSVPLLLKKLDEEGLRREDVEFLIITHVHLDHAGGSHALMEACPNATLLAHPRAAKHMIDPSRLVASAKAVYGEEEFRRLYGEIGPIPASRVREVADGEEIRFGSRGLRFFYTRGHANHHFCIHDTGANGVFTGDSFGLAYPDLQQKELFIFPSTSPTDFDPEEAKKSVRKIVETGAAKVWLTHYGEVTQVQAAARQLEKHLDFSAELLDSAVASGFSDEELTSFCLERLEGYYAGVMRDKGITLTPEVKGMLKLDLELNAAGIAWVAKKRRVG